MPADDHSRVRIIHAERVRQQAKTGGALVLLRGSCRMTDEARDLAHRLKVELVWKDEAELLSASRQHASARPERGKVQVALGSDHGGWELKTRLIRTLEAEGYLLRDLGCHGSEAVDYPVYARAVAQEVAGGLASRGIMIDSVGVASAMVCNRVAGVRAAACESLAAALSSRRHNDANLLTLGGKLVAPETAEEMVLAWLREAYEGGRHQRRVDLIMALDRSRG